MKLKTDGYRVKDLTKCQTRRSFGKKLSATGRLQNRQHNDNTRIGLPQGASEQMFEYLFG